MNRKFIFFPLVVLACMLLPMCSEEDVIDPDNVDCWQQYTLQDGLISNEIWSVAEDLYGNIWVGAATGLCRFDGTRFAQVGEEAGIYGYEINAIEMDKEGNLWVGSGWGLDILIDGEWIWINTLFDNPFITTSLYSNSHGDVWIGTFGNDTIPGGLFKYDYDNLTWWKYLYFEQLGFNNIYCISEDQNRNIWAGTDAGGVKLADPVYEIYNSSNELTFDNVTAIMQDAWGDIWFGTFDGNKVGRLHSNKMEMLSLYHGYDISGVLTITEDKNKNIWFGTGAGVIRYDGVIMDADPNSELTGSLITCSMTDSKDRIWFGTINKGLFVYVPE